MNGLSCTNINRRPQNRSSLFILVHRRSQAYAASLNLPTFKRVHLHNAQGVKGLPAAPNTGPLVTTDSVYGSADAVITKPTDIGTDRKLVGLDLLVGFERSRMRAEAESAITKGVEDRPSPLDRFDSISERTTSTTRHPHNRLVEVVRLWMLQWCTSAVSGLRSKFGTSRTVRPSTRRSTAVVGLSRRHEVCPVNVLQIPSSRVVRCRLLTTSLQLTPSFVVSCRRKGRHGSDSQR
jgi:hypothetical protein